MSMTRKDFEAIARILNYYRAEWRMVNEFADYLSTTNRAFDRERFMRAAAPADPYAEWGYTGVMFTDD